LTNHYLTITQPDGKHARANVTYLQPKGFWQRLWGGGE
jgi:hypothetical protein